MYCIHDKQDTEAATNWSEQKTSTWAQIDGAWVRTIHANTPTILNLKNEPITGLRVIDLERRGNGGRAYKVIDRNNYCFDIREDQLLESMVNLGIDQGGVLRGEWVWVADNGMKLIRKNSAEYDKSFANNTFVSKKPIPKSQLKPGFIYKSKSIEALFVGWYWVWEGRTIQRMLWLENSYKLLEKLSSGKEEFPDTFYWSIKTNHSFLEEVGQSDYKPDLVKLRSIFNTYDHNTYYQEELKRVRNLPYRYYYSDYEHDSKLGPKTDPCSWIKTREPNKGKCLHLHSQRTKEDFRFLTISETPDIVLTPELEDIWNYIK